MICVVIELHTSHLPLFHPLCFPNLMDLEPRPMAKLNNNPNTTERAEKGVSIQSPVPNISVYGGEMMLSLPSWLSVP